MKSQKNLNVKNHKVTNKNLRLNLETFWFCVV